MRRAATAHILLFLLFCAARVASAQVVELPPGYVETDVPPEEALHTGVASVLVPAPHDTGATTLADLVERLPGITLRRFGALGAPTTLSIRGLSGSNVAVVLDDVPMTSATLGATDLSLIVPEGLDRVVIYRGAGPARLGAPLGGVLQLRSAPTTERATASAHAGVGAFFTRTAHAALSGPTPWARYSASLAYQGSRGDFPFYDDRETLYTRADDVTRTRTNNDLDALTWRLGVDPLSLPARLRVHGRWREQGVPGPGASQAERSRAEELELLGRVSTEELDALEDRLRWQMGADVLTTQRTLRDPEHELGLRVGGNRAQLLRSGVDGRAQWLATLTHELDVAPRLAWERFVQRGAADASQRLDVRRQRLEYGVGLEHRWSATPSLTLVPAARVDGYTDGGRRVDRNNSVTQLSPRLGGMLQLGACTLRTNAGRFHRLPTLLERYGDGVVSVGSPDLRPEHGLSADAGGECTLDVITPDDLWLQLAIFANDARDLIVLQQSSQLTLIPTNVGKARTLGAEAALRASYGLATLDATYTHLRARDHGALTGTRGKVVPGLPEHQLNGALELGRAAWHLRYELDWSSRAYLDRANLRPVPARVLQHARAWAALGDTGFGVRVEVHNLADLRYTDVRVPGATLPARTKLADFLGYPLPGRAWFAGVYWRMTA